MKFDLIEKERAQYPVNVLCEVLEVSRSGFYAWRKRSTSQRQREDETLVKHIRAACKQGNGAYGSPRVTAELRMTGITVGRRRVARLMKTHALGPRRRRRYVTTTQSGHGKPVPPNLLNRDFSATRPDEKWVGDITYLPTQTGFLYLAVLLDLYSRRVVGWSISHRLDATLAIRALEVALATREPRGRLIHHTDRGSQYVDKDYVQRLEALGIKRSMSRVGNCWDNAPVESFFASLKAEVPEATSAVSHHTDVRRAVTQFLEHYNSTRRHSTIGYLSPVDFEAARMGRAA